VAEPVALRTFQRGLKVWRALHGPPKEVFFPQAHEPGRAAQFDWKRAGELGITIAGAPFEHLLGHFVLPYSNWQRATVCFSESFGSLKTHLAIRGSSDFPDQAAYQAFIDQSAFFSPAR